MTGLGYYYASSSSSSSSTTTSNLSPLAPPFTVDRNKPVANSTLPPDFTSSLPYSPYSTTGAGAGLGFSGDSPPNDPVISRWSYFERVSDGVSDSMFYDHHRPYGSMVKKNGDDAVPLVRVSESSSDLLSGSGVGYSGSDYTGKLPGLEYDFNPNPNPNKEGVSGAGKEKLAAKDGGFFFGEGDTAAASSFGYNSFMDQGAYGTETLSKGKDDPSMSYYADMIRIANNNGKSDTTSFFANTHSRLDSNEFPKEESHFGAFSVFSEAPPSLVQSLEDPFWNSQKLTPTYEKRHHNMFEDCNSKPTTKSSRIVIKSPAAAVSASSGSSKSLEIRNAAEILNANVVAVDNIRKILKEKDELHLPQLSFQIGTSSSIKDTKLSPASDQLNFEFKAKPSVLKLPDINIPEAANPFDHHNPAEDSPCWKGSPFLPFGSPETQPSAKKLQKDTKIQGTDYSPDGKTSSNPAPIHADISGDVDFSKVRDGVDDVIKPHKGHDYDANSQTPKPKLPNLEEAVMLLAEMDGEAGDIKVNASVLVKAVYNLSDLLLWACSNDALKEHDREALDRVTRNLGVCMSRHVQLAAASTNKQESQVMNVTCGTLHDGDQHAHYQKMKSDVCGESVKNLLEHVSLRDLDTPKGDNMVQAIKKVLDENLEREVEDSSENALLYKNLWLEAEAELCCSSYRARYERLKRETQKEKPHKPTVTGDASAIKETSRSCNASTFLKADNIKTSNAQHTDDAVNVHGGQDPVKEGPVTHVADVKVTGSGVTVQHQPFKDDDNGVESWVLERLNILKNREQSNAIDREEAGAYSEVRESHFHYQEEAVAAVGSGSDWEHITWR